MPVRRLSKTPNEFFRRLATERRKNQHSPVSRSEEFDDFVDKFLLPDKSGTGAKLKFDQADKSGNGARSNLYGLLYNSNQVLSNFLLADIAV